MINILTLCREVEAVEHSDLGYTMAVDMWSLGVLTACMFTGDTIIPRHELPELSFVEIAARYIGVDDSFAKVAWQQIPPRPLNFIRRLIIIDPKERMTAEEALEDSWYTKPSREATALAEAVERICRFWKKCSAKEDIMKGFPGVIVDLKATADFPVAKARKKFPDVTSSPYFGLDRHLQPRQTTTSTRKRVLDDLTQSGSQFLRSVEPDRTEPPFKKKRARIRRPSMISVEGDDIFDMSPKKNIIQDSVSELDGADIGAATPFARRDKAQTITGRNPISLQE